MLSRLRGASYLEFVIAVALIFCLIVVAIKLVLKFSIESEQIEVQQVINELQQSVLVLTSEQMVQQNKAALQQWHASNPMKLLRATPKNYLGELGDKDRVRQHGVWYYNYDRDALIYKVRHASYLSSQGPEGEIEFKLDFKFADSNNNQVFDREIDKAYGLVLEPVHPYQWLDAE